jgi:NAD(P)-dependent dehydrogenase (short-subunit alcohol dehydrogenase family)
MARSDSTAIPNQPLADKVVVVTGAGRGIGRSTARKLALAGAHVALVARTAADLEAAVAEIEACGGKASAFVADVAQPGELQALADEMQKTHGRVDVLVNSAGASLIAPLEATTEADWDHIIGVNLKAPYLCIHTLLDLLRAADGAQIVNIASKVGLTGHRLVTAYSAAKAGLIGFSRALAQELSEENIRVIVICPGPVDTPMRWAATPNIDPRLVISAETVAETILYLVSLDSHATVSNEVVIEALGYDESAVSLER